MKLLLDTHVIVWWLLTPEVIAPAAAKAIADPANEVSVSAASFWEMSIKQALGKLSLPGDAVAAAEANGFARLAISAEHGWRAGALPAHHRDPFDRVLVAQAEMEGLVIVTRDDLIPKYGVPVFPA